MDNEQSGNFQNIVNEKYETLINSYNSFKLILSPNLGENNKQFMNSLINLIISQLKIFLTLINSEEKNKTYDLLNINNQSLSEQLAILYEIPKSIENDSIKSSLSKGKYERNNKKIYTNNTHIKTYKKKDPIIKVKKIYNEEKNDKNLYQTEKIKNREKERDSILKKDRVKFKEKERLSQNLKKSEKDFKLKEKKINNKKVRINEPKFKKTSSMIKKVASFDKFKKTLNESKSRKHLSPPHSPHIEKIVDFPKNKDKEINIYEMNPNNVKSLRCPIKHKTRREDNKHLVFDFDDDKNSMINENGDENEKQYKRKDKKSKTVLYESFKIPYLINKNNLFMDECISFTFSNKNLFNENKLKKIRKKDNFIQIIVEEKNNNNNKANMNDHYDFEMQTNTIKAKHNMNSIDDHFSLDKFLMPYKTKDGEELFLTKTGNTIITKKQRAILEDYINNYLMENEDENTNRNDNGKSYNNLKLKFIKEKRNKKFYIKGTNITYDINEIDDLLHLVTSSLQISIDDFLKKKKASFFDRNIFKKCYKVINNYKKLEDNFRSQSGVKTESRTRRRQKLTMDKKNLMPNFFSD